MYAYKRGGGKITETKGIATSAIVVIAVVVIAVIAGAAFILSQPSSTPTTTTTKTTTTSSTTTSAPTTIHILAYEDIDKWMPQLVDAYNAETGKNLKLDIARFEYNQQSEILSSRIAAGQPVDVVYCTGDAVRPAIKAGVFRNMWDYFTPDFFNTTFPVGITILEGAAKSVGVNNMLPMIPYGAQVFGIYYNKVIFDKLGITVPNWQAKSYPDAFTFDEFYAMGDKIRNAGYIPIAIHGGETWAYFQVIETAMIAHVNGDILNDLYWPTLGGQMKFTDPLWVDIFREVQTITAKEFGSGFAAETESSAATLFATGKAAMFYDGTWGLRYLTPVMSTDFQFGYMPFPYNPAYHGQSLASITPDLGITTTASDALAQEIVGFFKYLYRDDVIVKASDPALRPGVGAPFKSTYGDQIVAKGWYNPPEMLSSVTDLLAHAIPDPTWLTVPELWNEILIQTSNVATGTSTPEQATQAIQTMYEKDYSNGLPR